MSSLSVVRPFARSQSTKEGSIALQNSAEAVGSPPTRRRCVLTHQSLSGNEATASRCSSFEAQQWPHRTSALRVRKFLKRHPAAAASAWPFSVGAKRLQQITDSRSWLGYGSSQLNRILSEPEYWDRAPELSDHLVARRASFRAW